MTRGETPATGSAEAHDRHLKGAHVQALVAAMAGTLAEPSRIVAYGVLDEQ